MHCLEGTSGLLGLHLVLIVWTSCLSWVIVGGSFHELLFGLFMRLDATTLVRNFILIA